MKCNEMRLLAVVLRILQHLLDQSVRGWITNVQSHSHHKQTTPEFFRISLRLTPQLEMGPIRSHVRIWETPILT